MTRGNPSIVCLVFKLLSSSLFSRVPGVMRRSRCDIPEITLSQEFVG